jgi:hypothetical protein
VNTDGISISHHPSDLSALIANALKPASRLPQHSYRIPTAEQTAGFDERQRLMERPKI